MTTRFFVDATGNFIGSIGSGTVTAADGSSRQIDTPPPEGGIEVKVPPANGLQKWNGSAWEDTPASLAIVPSP